MKIAGTATNKENMIRAEKGRTCRDLMLGLDNFERVNHFRILVHLIEAKLVAMGTDQTDRVIVLAHN